MVKKSAHKGKHEVSVAVAAPVAPPVVETPPQVEYEQREEWYRPETADWLYFASAVSDDGMTLVIHENTGINGREQGALVATITVSPEFGRKDAARIANLMASAPGLYRDLRTLAPYAVGGAEGLDEFNAAVETMFLAINGYPYAFPREEETDEQVYKRLHASRGRVRKFIP